MNTFTLNGDVYEAISSINEGVANLGYNVKEVVDEAVDNILDDNILDNAEQDEKSKTSIQKETVDNIIDKKENNNIFDFYMINKNHSNLEININVFEEYSNIFNFNKQIYEQDSENTISFLITGNHLKKINPNKIFEAGKSEKNIYSNIHEYRNKNGRFSYGNTAGISIANEISFFYKEKNKNWMVINLIFNEKDFKAFKTKPRRITLIEESKLNSKGVDLNIESGTILYVKKIRKQKYLPLTLNEIVEQIKQHISVTYFHEIQILKKKIIINGTEIKGIHPLGLDLLASNLTYIMPRVFAKYEITLEEILNELGKDFNSEEWLEDFKELFKQSGQKLDIKNESIKIILITINPNLNKSNMRNLNSLKKYENLSKIYFPNYDYSGFFILRNNRYINSALGMLGIVKDHPDYTRFRGQISFNPIFDSFFNIQPNKNKNHLDHVIVHLLQKKILKDDNLNGDSVTSKIKNAIKDSNKAIKDKKIITIEERKLNLVCKAEKLKIHLDKYHQDSNNICNIITKINNQVTDDGLSSIEKDLRTLNCIYEKNKEILFDDIDRMVKRATKINKRKCLDCNQEFLNTEKYNNIDKKLLLQEIIYYFGNPFQEIELQILTYIIYSINPINQLPKFNILDSKTDEGLDSLIQIHNNLFNELNWLRCSIKSC